MYPNNLFTIETVKTKKLVVNENLLDIYKPRPFDIPHWEPTKTIPDISTVKTLFFDIETTDLNPASHQIKMIGCMMNGKTIVFDWINYSETEILQGFFFLLEKTLPDIIIGHNIWAFDIPFIIQRSIFLRIKHPFFGGNEKVFRTAQTFGQPAVFKQYWLQLKGKKIDIIDTMLQAKSKDFSERKLNSFSLKSIPVEWGLREKNDRIELSLIDMTQCYITNNVKKMTEYLLDDLKDTKLIFDRVFPEIYYQQLFLNWRLQSLATSGNGSKWNSILSEFYQEEFKADEKLSFDGGYTWGKAGIFKNIEKLDVSSLYPSIQLRYGIHSSKDYNRYQLRILNYLRTERLRLKKLKHDKKAQDQSDALKLFINSSYGFLGVAGLAFNDMRAGALVTAYGRLIVNRMRSIIDSLGAECIEIDTDGILFELNGHNGEDIRSTLQKNLPDGISVDREKFGDSYTAKLLYVPPKDLDEGNEDNGLRKNYVIIGKNKTIAKGRFVKRCFCKLQREFQVKFLELYVKSENEAMAYYRDLISLIGDGKLSIEDIKIRRKAKCNEKKVYELNLVDHNTGLCEYYYVPKMVIKRKKSVWESDLGNTGPYCVQYYTNLIKKQFMEMKQFFDR